MRPCLVASSQQPGSTLPPHRRCCSPGPVHLHNFTQPSRTLTSQISILINGSYLSRTQGQAFKVSQMIGKYLLPILLMIPLIGQARAEALRCGSEFVEMGDFKADVPIKCGEPFLKDTVYVDSGESVTGAVDKHGRCLAIDQWTYNPGPGQLLTVLDFRPGDLCGLGTGGGLSSSRSRYLFSPLQADSSCQTEDAYHHKEGVLSFSFSSCTLAHHFPEHQSSQTLRGAPRYVGRLTLASGENGDHPLFDVVRTPVLPAVHSYLYGFCVLPHFLCPSGFL
jgi:hypothetical protein